MMSVPCPSSRAFEHPHIHVWRSISKSWHCDANWRCFSARGRGGCGSQRYTGNSGSCSRACGPNGARRSSWSSQRPSSPGTDGGFRLSWTWKSRHRTGRPSVPSDFCTLIRAMAEANRRWSAPGIHGELPKLGNRHLLSNWRPATVVEFPEGYASSGWIRSCWRRARARCRVTEDSLGRQLANASWLLRLDSNPPPLKLRRSGQQPSG